MNGTLYRLQGPTETQLPLLENGPGEHSLTSSLIDGNTKQNDNINHSIDDDDEQKQVSDYCIEKVLMGIDEAEYLKTLKRMTEQKLATLKSEKNIFVKKSKLQNFLLQKGYEMDLIGKEVEEITKKN